MIHPTSDHQLKLALREISKKIAETGDYLKGYKIILEIVGRHGYRKLE
jgi:hypothetical protein